jgi:hypothetical protein
MDGQTGGQTAGQASALLAKPINGPLTGPLHGPVNALRAPLRRYPGEATTENTAERFPTASEFISHVG